MNASKLGESMTNTKKFWTQPTIKMISLNAAENGASQPGNNDGISNKS